MTCACSTPAYRPVFSQKQPRTTASRLRLRASPEYVCSGSHHLPTSARAAHAVGGETLGASTTWRTLNPAGVALTISALAWPGAAQATRHAHPTVAAAD